MNGSLIDFSWILEEGEFPSYTCPCSSLDFSGCYCQEQVTQENAMAKS